MSSNSTTENKVKVKREPPPAPPPKTKSRDKCDLCEKKDGFMGFHLLKCKVCGVCVHETCYGLPQTEEGKPSWECHACAAVGKTFVVSKPGEKPRTMKQEHRATDCALCPIFTGVHAMHKLYDTHGKDGVQAVLRHDRKRDLPERLAWVHSACAFGIGSSRMAGGCVYGCAADGSYEGGSDSEEEGEEEEDDDAEGSPANKKARTEGVKSEEGEDDEEEYGAVHHFVISGKEDGQETFWTNIIHECRTLLCFICGNTQCPPTHIPLQCCANEEDEFHEFKTRHDNTLECYQAMHVGCARWVDAPHRRVFFYPGMEDKDDSAPWMTRYDELVKYKAVNGNCKVPMQSGLLGEWVARQRKFKKRKDEGKDADITKKQIKMLNEIGIDWNGEMQTEPVNEVYCDLHAEEVYRNAPKRSKPTQQTAQQTRVAAATAAGPPTQRASVPTGNLNRAQAARPTSQAPRSSSSAAAAAAAAAASSIRRPGAAPARSSASSATDQPGPPEEVWFEDIKDDVVTKIRRAHRRNNNVQEATNSVREHWKNQKLMTKREFKSVWNRVKAAIEAMPDEELFPPSENQAETDAAEEGAHSETNRWASIWEPGGHFEFGDWDTYEVMKREGEEVRQAANKEEDKGQGEYM